MEESIIKAFDEHINILKRLNAFSVSDMKKCLFNSKYFHEYYSFEITSYNETIHISRLIDRYMNDPSYSKEQKEFFIGTLNAKLKKMRSLKYIDLPDYIDRKSRIEFIEEHKIALGLSIMQIMFDDDFKDDQEIKKFMHDYLECEEHLRTLFIHKNFSKIPIKYQKNASKAIKKQLKRKLSSKIVWPIIDANYELMSTSKEDFERKIYRDVLFDKLENDILEIGVRIMERKNTKRIENLLNDDLTDHLRTKGYQVYDQTRSGKSESGKHAGSLDIMIRDAKNLPLAIIEGMRLSSIGEKNKTLDNHIVKLLDNYDTSKLSVKYIVVFCEASDFINLCERYSLYLNNFSEHTKGRYKLDSVGYTKKPFGDSINSIRTIDSYSRINGSYAKLKHILLDMV